MHKAKILVVDDDEDFRDLLTEIFEQAGYGVIEAVDGEQAIGRFRENQIGLVITDMVMPKKEGIEVILELCRDYPEIPIIAISGGGRLSSDDYLAWAEECGAARAFTKPFERQQILGAVQELLKQEVTPEKDKKILIIYDSSVARKILKMHLKNFGYSNLLEADNGLNGLEVLTNEKIDLIISDWNMPTMTGIQLLKIIRADPNLQHVPFVMITAESTADNMLEATGAKVTEYLAKPFDTKSLKTMLDRIFK
jgi:CheY-like chemotaxis protein